MKGEEVVAKTIDVENVRNQAMLAMVRISCWTGRVRFDEGAVKVGKLYGVAEAAATKTGTFDKVLVSVQTSPEYAEIRKAEALVRLYHHQLASAWIDGGQRIVQASMYKEYITKIRKAKEQFTNAVENFIEKYPEIKAKAKERMKELFDEESDWPTEEHLRRLFRVEVTFQELGKGDFRLGLESSDIEELRVQYREKVTEHVQAGIRSAVQLLKDRATKLEAWTTKRTEDNKIVGDEKFDARIEDLRDDIRRAEVLNYNHDPLLETLIERFKLILGCTSTQLPLVSQMCRERLTDIEEWYSLSAIEASDDANESGAVPELA